MARAGSGKGRSRTRAAGSEGSDTTDAVNAAPEATARAEPDTTAESTTDQPSEAGPAATDPRPAAPEPAGTPASETSRQESLAEPQPEPSATARHDAVNPPLPRIPIAPAGDGLPLPHAPASAEPAPATEPARRGEFWAPLAGGVFAAAVGAGVVLALFPQGWQPVETSVLEVRLSALEAQVRAAADATDTGQGAALEGLDSRLAGLEAALAEIAAPVDLAPFVARLDALESAPTPEAALEPAIAAAIAPLHERLDRLEGDLAARISAAVATEQQAQQERAAALENAERDLARIEARLAARAALAELTAAAQTGAPAGAALATLGAAVALPADLDAFADGLQTLGALQADFAPAARAALAAAPLAPDAPITDRVLDFLRSQTGARSLAPREGDDADAILSRAEARLNAADLAGALDELAALPAESAAAMAGWLGAARTRQSAIAALETLRGDLAHD